MATILSVCTGNICRSPASALLVDRHLGDLASSVSAGTRALDGHGIPAEMLAELAADGIDGEAHRGRLLTPAMVREADLIVAMTREHRTLIVQLEPRGLRRTFTLAELAAAAGTGAALEGATPLDRLAGVPAAIGAHRPVLAQYDLADVPDPYRRSADAYHDSYVLIRDAVARVAEWIRTPA